MTEKARPPKPPAPIRKRGSAHKGWKVVDMWAGATCVILGGGPSLNSVDLSLFYELRVIAVNNAYGTPIVENGKTIKYEPRPWVDVCWFGDERWWRWHKKYLRHFPGLICCCRENLNGVDGLYGVCRGKPLGLETRPRFIAWNKSSGASAINLAYHLGARKVILLGFDMRRVDNKPNWHDDHPAPGKNPYERFLKAFPVIAQDAKKLGLEIINATPGSAITQFPIMTPEEAIKNCQSKP